jgi:hypothetical protein
MPLPPCGPLQLCQQALCWQTHKHNKARPAVCHLQCSPMCWDAAAMHINTAATHNSTAAIPTTTTTTTTAAA